MTRRRHYTPPGPLGLWQPSNWYLAQVVHLVSGAVIMESLFLHTNVLWWKASLCVGILTGLKEYVIDCSAFEGDSVWGSTQDWLFYLLGVGLADVAQWNFVFGATWGGVSVLLLFLYDLWRHWLPKA